MSEDSMEEDHGIGESIYDEENRSDAVEDDELAPHEEGFMQGYEAANEEEEPESVRLEESDDEEE